MNAKCDKRSDKEYIKYIIIVMAVIALFIDCIYLGKTNNMDNFEKIAIIAGVVAGIGFVLFVFERKNKESLFKQEQDRIVYDMIMNLSDEDKKLSLLKDLVNME